eukprot:1016422-Prorocentrum_minimum.AAC.1
MFPEPLAGHPHSVDALVKVDEDLVFTGSSDGIIRLVQILPNKLMGVVGEHMDCPIERLAISPDRRHVKAMKNNKQALVGVVGEHMDCPIECLAISRG